MDCNRLTVRVMKRKSCNRLTVIVIMKQKSCNRLSRVRLEWTSLKSLRRVRMSGSHVLDWAESEWSRSLVID